MHVYYTSRKTCEEGSNRDVMEELLTLKALWDGKRTTTGWDFNREHCFMFRTVCHVVVVSFNLAVISWLICDLSYSEEQLHVVWGFFKHIVLIKRLLALLRDTFYFSRLCLPDFLMVPWNKTLPTVLSTQFQRIKLISESGFLSFLSSI